MRQLVINTQERAISTDINRLQKFKEKNVSELLRYWLDVTGNDDVTTGQITEPNTVETPLRAEIMNGLLVKPQTGTGDLLVDPGVVMVMNPDAVADESNYKYVRDPGVPAPGTLTIAAGGGGGTRIDIIECQINSIDEIVTDNRDIFNATTGLYGVASVTKERERRLTYRVRQGTAGGGMPALALGWLPLCVASVPDPSANNDTVTFWDVRPLVSDRSFGGFNLSRDEIAHYSGRAMATAASFKTLTGILDLVSFKGRRIGGRLRSGVPGTANVDSIALDDAKNWDTNLVAGGLNNQDFWAYLATPFGLPRWARYTSTGTRLPRSPRGIVILSQTGPNMKGAPLAALALPPSTGLGGTTTEAVCWAQSRVSGGANNANAFSIENRTQRLPIGVTKGAAGAALGVGTADFVLTPNTDFPQNAKSLWVTIFVQGIVADATQLDLDAMKLQWFVAGNAANSYTQVEAEGPTFINNSGGPLTVGHRTARIRIPVPTEYPAATLTTPTLLRATWGGLFGPLTATVASLSVVGWDF